MGRILLERWLTDTCKKKKSISKSLYLKVASKWMLKDLDEPIMSVNMIGREKTEKCFA